MFDVLGSVVTIAGSPSAASRSSAVLDYIRQLLNNQHVKTSSIAIRDLDAQDLLLGRYDSPSFNDSKALIEQAQAVIIATPVYKAAYSGVLKTFLDILPQNAFAGKIVLPIATGGSIAHLLSIDYALKPVISALGAQHILSGVYIVDSQIKFTSSDAIELDAEVDVRLRAVLTNLTSLLQKPVAVVA